jgi:hypothetical protein
MDGCPKMCDTNKNVTKMGVIIKGFTLQYMEVFECLTCCKDMT